MPCDMKALRAWATEEVEGIIEGLPAPLRQKAQDLPVTMEAAPEAGLIEDGIEVDTLGLFTGADHDSEDALPLPPQIILFLENLWDFSEGDAEVFREEVRRTYLHELGHYLGLDEDDLWDRGLD